MATVKSTAQLEEEIFGRWKNVKTEGIKQLRELFSLDESMVPDQPWGVTEISKEADGIYAIESSSEWGTNRMRVELGRPHRDTVMGREMDLVVIWEGPRLTTKIVGTNDNMLTREVVDGKLVSVVHINDIVVTTVAEKC
ncbi:uncharacterized protein LOC110977622 [Acanthaster planci]|uniref:Uncharacterized protein LOC110977622 n=1 Tax=Acanthaster planci TaxID=133434 RepID=A0A8B7Y742_ACAPL|nr:uncharacterized protein LOC110977622 [Acanthaster planci]XP_022087601.1 uncharacterized protein LOC110977622 [Acanthaster planci]XP_022087602.1 uncharacterized protein LOC110977622 [Acanthaster planci]XP_022087603.1 uncharacterized protein LOC110977622 [Acanthaster planci]